MKDFLYWIVGLFYKAHEAILSLNDSYETKLTDKELHFIVIGIIGMILIFVVYPLFKWLAKKHHVMVIAWLYVFTVIIVITFAIEIGQGATGTGTMDFADIMFGVLGFLAFFAVFAVIRGIAHLIVKLMGNDAV